MFHDMGSVFLLPQMGYLSGASLFSGWPCDRQISFTLNPRSVLKCFNQARSQNLGSGQVGCLETNRLDKNMRVARKRTEQVRNRGRQVPR